MFTKTIEDARKKGINLLQKHEVKSVDFDEKKVFVEDLENAKEKVFDYNELVIATGASPFIPDIEGINSENVYTLTKPYIAKDLKENIDNYKNIAIVGGGFIGVEVAEQLSRYDHLNISLYHSRDQLLNGVYDTKAGIAAKDEIEKLGVNIHFSERLEDVVAEDKTVKKIITSNRQDEVDAIILAIGVRPNTRIFNNGRLKKIKNGAIVIDKYGRTNIENVWSVGDCATVPHKFLKNPHIPLGTSANKIGRQIGINLSRDKDNLFASYESLSSSSVKIGELEFGTTGLTESQAKDLGYYYDIAESEVLNKPSYMHGSHKIDFRIIYEKNSYRILGARVFGKNDALMRLHPFTTAIHAGLTTKDLTYYDYAYSPPFSLSWDAINIASSVAK
ncbi:MAG: FAD-dependent oxidoreductase [Senegalia sp. (in: firmicutes)]|uniref:FAD-dependent oxidoreductase n=2 Tax=Senegalia sp. (in: firmicutes) TaxID=1924098 RepID=UPI003F960339